MNLSYLKSVSGILKIVEIVFVITAYGLTRDKNIPGFGGTTQVILNNFYFGVGVLTAAMVVTPLLLAVYLTGKMEIQKSIFEPVLNAFFGASFVVYGSLMLDNYSNALLSEPHDYGIAAGSFILMAGVTYGVDLFFSIKNFSG